MVDIILWIYSSFIFVSHILCFLSIKTKKSKSLIFYVDLRISSDGWCIGATPGASCSSWPHVPHASCNRCSDALFSASSKRFDYDGSLSWVRQNQYLVLCVCYFSNSSGSSPRTSVLESVLVRTFRLMLNHPLEIKLGLLQTRPVVFHLMVKLLRDLSSTGLAELKLQGNFKNQLSPLPVLRKAFLGLRSQMRCLKEVLKLTLTIS